MRCSHGTGWVRIAILAALVTAACRAPDTDLARALAGAGDEVPSRTRQRVLEAAVLVKLLGCMGYDPKPALLQAFNLPMLSLPIGSRGRFPGRPFDAALRAKACSEVLRITTGSENPTTVPHDQVPACSGSVSHAALGWPGGWLGTVDCQEWYGKDCVGSRCADGACSQTACIGSTVGYCADGVRHDLECGQVGLGCGDRGDGEPACAATGPACTDTTLRCEGNTLVACLDGREARFDCEALGLGRRRCQEGPMPDDFLKDSVLDLHRGCVPAGTECTGMMGPVETGRIRFCVDGYWEDVRCAEYGFATCEGFFPTREEPDGANDADGADAGEGDEVTAEEVPLPDKDRPVGSPCTADDPAKDPLNSSQCKTGSCLTTEFVAMLSPKIEFPRGMCSAFCERNAGCEPGGLCVNLPGMEGMALCLHPCTSDSDCRTEDTYRCPADAYDDEERTQKVRPCLPESMILLLECNKECSENPGGTCSLNGEKC